MVRTQCMTLSYIDNQTRAIALTTFVSSRVSSSLKKDSPTDCPFQKIMLDRMLTITKGFLESKVKLVL